MDYQHLPVMSDEIVDFLAPCLNHPGALLLDATVGLGGHSAAILARFTGARVIAIDRDPQAIAHARQRLVEVGENFQTFQGTYDRVAEALAGREADAILFDLGLSSLQIDSAERGFAYAWDAPLDMRMDADEAGLTAADVVNTYTADDLARIFYIYGDEKFSRRIAAAIVAARTAEPFTSSARLVETVASAVPAASRSGHPAKRVFQAIRMEVNDERRLLELALPAALAALVTGGRLAVLSYHSGEDRLVKHCFAQAASDHVPAGIAVVPPAYRAQFRLVTHSAQKPSATEIAANPRSQSARLRVIERKKEEEE